MVQKKKPAEAPRPGEFELISRYFAPLSGEGSFGLLDDAALVAVSAGKALALTQDALAAGVHFFADDPPDLIARKALRVNLSDLAAKGARPVGFSLALGLADDWDEAWIAAFARGLGQDCRAYGVALTGGDTFRSPERAVVSITAWGEVDPARYASRLGAGDGDRLFVTGTIGDGAMGLKARRGELSGLERATVEALTRSYLLPEPPVAFAPVIAEFATASMDISDGLAGDLAKLAAASGVDFDVPSAAVPLSAEVREALAMPGMLEAALTGGDDYQILFTAPEAKVAQLLEKAQKAAVRVTELARARAGSGKVTFADGGGVPMRFRNLSFAHF